MPFQRHMFRDGKVYARVDQGGKLVTDGKGRVEIRYKLGDSRSYTAAAGNLRPIAGAPIEEAEGGEARAKEEVGPAKATPSRGAAAKAPSTSERPRPAGEPIIIYTDGACSGNPGPMGIGVVLMSGGRRKEISEYLGIGTNNIAELTAVERALEAVKDRARPVLVHTDSSYAIGLLSAGWKAKANGELVERIRALLREFASVRFVKVAGHAGIPENERCDELAREAITNRND